MSNAVSLDGMQQAVNAACKKMDELRAENALFRAVNEQLLLAMKNALYAETNEQTDEILEAAIAETQKATGTQP